ncbi:MAG: mechanosensitive ion channel [Terricaulis sp.]
MLLVQTTTSTHQPLLARLQALVVNITRLDPGQAALRGGLTILVFIGAALVVWGLHVALDALTERLFPKPADGTEKKTPRRDRIGRVSLAITRFVVFIAAILVTLRVWGLDLGVLTEGPVGAVLNIAGHVALIVVLALVAMEASQLAITQVFTRIALHARTPRRASQLRTLAPLLAGVVNTALVVLAAMMALSQVGVQIGPLLAGAGIVGVAVGFGAQTLVKDFLTGIFLIIEDTVSVGDAVKIGDWGGTVEEMSLRTIKLRDFDGTLHVFPYSEAQVIHNQSKNFSYYVIELVIAKSADIGHAMELMRAAGGEVQQDENLGGLVMSSLEIAGVDKITDAGISIKARIKTMPGMQYKVGRDLLRRIKIAFDENGVDTPTPSVKLLVPDNKPI